MNLPQIKGPGWPTIEHALVAIFALLAWKLLVMIEKNPALLANASFMQFAGLLTGGGLLLAGSHYFQLGKPHKAEERKDETIQTLADKVPPVTGEAADVRPQPDPQAVGGPSPSPADDRPGPVAGGPDSAGGAADSGYPGHASGSSDKPPPPGEVL